MSPSRRTSLLAAVCLLLMPTVRAQNTGISGHWEGTIEMPKQEVGVTVDLATSPAGTWIGSMSVSGASAVDVPLLSLAVDGASVRFSARLPEEAMFDLTVSSDAKVLSGLASNDKGSAPFQLKRGGEANVKVPPPSSPLPKQFEGTWSGIIDADGRVRHIALTLSRSQDGTAAGTLIAVDQGNLEIPATTVTFKDMQLTMEARAVSGRYQGALTGGVITGEWTQGETHVPLTFTRTPADVK